MCPPHSERPQWLAPLSDPRNEEILTAAFELFCENGLHGTTMLEVATAAKVSKETLYARFDSKEGLFYALLAWGAERSAAPQQPEALLGDDPRAALMAYAEDTLIKMLRPEAVDVHRIVVGEALRMPQVAEVFYEFTCGAGAKHLAPIHQKLVDAGVIARSDPAVFGDVFLGLLRGDLHHKVTLGIMPLPPEDDLRRYARTAMENLLKVFAP